MPRHFGIIPQPTRAEKAARISTAYLPIDDSMSAGPGPVIWIAVVAAVALAVIVASVVM